MTVTGGIKDYDKAVKSLNDYLVPHINSAYQHHIFPSFFLSKLKQAKTIPVYKSDDETEPGNYRPISLLSIFNRIFENFMYRQLKTFLDKNDILFTAQYGFHEKHSTQHAIDIVNYTKHYGPKIIYTWHLF